MESRYYLSRGAKILIEITLIESEKGEVAAVKPKRNREIFRTGKNRDEFGILGHSDRVINTLLELVARKSNGQVNPVASVGEKSEQLLESWKLS